MQESVAVRNAKLDAIETTAGTGALLKIYTGAMPANCAASETGTLLDSMTLPSDWLANASAGAKAKTGTWSGVAAASGYAEHWRIYDSTGTTCHMQGLCSQAWAAATAAVVGEYIGNGGNVYGCTTAGITATAWAISTAYALNQTVSNGGNTYIATTAGTSASSGGGPTGTGAGITDGTAVWAYQAAGSGPSGTGATIHDGTAVFAYIGLVDMTLDNVNINAGQTVTVNTFTLTEGNA